MTDTLSAKSKRAFGSSIEYKKRKPKPNEALPCAINVMLLPVYVPERDNANDQRKRIKAAHF